MDIKLQTIPAISYAGAQNYIVILQEIHVHNNSEGVISNLELYVSANPEFAKPIIIHIAQIDAGATHSIYDYDWILKHDYLVQLEEAVRGNIRVELYHQEKIIASNTMPIEVLAYDQWAGFRQLPELITAFSQPNSPAISELLRAASNKLLQQYQQSLLECVVTNIY